MIDVHDRKRRQRSRVNLPVAYQASFLSERFPAHVAHVNPLAGVQQQMLAQTTVSGERSGADGTPVRFVASVYPHVLPEVVVLEERLPALLADRLLLLLVLRQHVLVQVLLGHQPPPAHRALVLRLVMGVFLMSVQAVAVPARFPANVAHHGRFPVIQSRVRGQVALDLELLAALLARVLVTLRVLSHEVRTQRLLPGTDETADDARELSLAGELTLARVTVVFSQMGDHRRSLVATEVANRAGQSFLLLRQRQLHETTVSRRYVSSPLILVGESVPFQQIFPFELFLTDVTR